MAFEVGGGKKGIRPSMNVTPLVDVVLVLLIIFMVITPMLVKQLSVNVPTKPKDDKTAEPDKPDPDEEPQVILRVAADGSAWINTNRIPDAELDLRLKRVFAARADQTLFFDADDNVRFERALTVLDIARGTGLATIAVLTEPVVTQ
jgi:biopolymer transport protein ExbD